MTISNHTGVTRKMEAVASPVEQIPSRSTRPGASGKRLKAIAVEIRREHQAVLGGIRQGIEHARQVGELLLEAKKAVKHGHWASFVKGCGFGERSAQNYMQIASRWSAIAKAKSLAKFDLTVNGVLTINDALKLVANPKKPKRGDIAPDGTGASWAKDDSQGVRSRIDTALEPLSSSLATVIADQGQENGWDSAYKVSLAKRLVTLARQATKAAAVLRASARSKRR